MKRYTLYSGLYRFFNGVVLLLLNWHIASSQGGGYDALAISTALSFVPAVFVPPLIRFSPIVGGARMTAAGLAGVSLTLLLIAAGYDHVTLVVALNFVLWIFFFFLESTWEVWFNDEASGLDDDVLRKHSSLTMTVNQVALMVGPLFAPLFTRVIRAEWVVVVCAVLFAAVAVLSLGAHRTAAATEQEQQKEVGPKRPGSLSLLYLLAFMLVWPILGTFNLMLPLQALANGKSMLTVGIMDMFLGIGMAVAGTFLHRLTKSLGSWVLVGAAVAVAAAMALWLAVPAFGAPQMVAIFALGCAFGSLRVLLRAEAASAFSPRQVGAIVANANASSLVLLAAVLAGGRYFSSHIWLAPFALTLLLVLAFHGIRKVQSSRPIPIEVST